MLIEKVWNKILEVCEKKYDLDSATTDIRFIFVVYIFYIKNDTYKYNFKSVKLLKTALSNYIQIFGQNDRPLFTSFQRSIYRISERITPEGVFVDLYKLLKSITEGIE